jgi:hypothetical protein
MSYTLQLQCGCVAYVACDPQTGISHKRVIESRATSCGRRSHRRGERLWLWELLPDPCHPAVPEFVQYYAGPMSVP